MSKIIYLNKNPKRRPRFEDEMVEHEFMRVYPLMIAEYCAEDLTITQARVVQYIRAAGIPTECSQTYIERLHNLGWRHISESIIEELDHAHWIYTDIYNEFIYAWAKACDMIPPVYHGDDVKINNIRGCAFLSDELTKSAQLLFKYHDKQSFNQSMKEVIVNWEDVEQSSRDIDIYQST